ncbi:hypothetical protein JTB14_009608 [Gonioctena quinquepunctata]|nr:hypothetical protein JTB14_009608 [Gonioctena quinquepunctata]
MDGQSGRSRTQKGINKSLNPDFEWPPGFGMSSKPGMDSIRNNMEITEPALETKNTGKTSSKIYGNSKKSISEYSRVSGSSSIDLQKKKLALEAEKKKHYLETKIIEQQIKLVELETQVREAEITQERRSIRTRSSVPRQENRNLYPEVIVLPSASCRNQNITFDNERFMNDSCSSRVNSFVADWVEKVKSFDNEEWEEKNAHKTPLPDKSEIYSIDFSYRALRGDGSFSSLTSKGIFNSPDIERNLEMK